MRNYLLLFLFAVSLLGTVPATTISQLLPSHCRANEQVFFNCKAANGKLISLCGSKQLSATKGYVQYRFGKVGSIELQFPEKLEGSQKEFRYDHYFRYRVDRSDITFKAAGYEYTVFDYWDGDMKPEGRTSGVTVQSLSNEQNYVQIGCRVRGMSRLVALEEVVPALEPSVLNPE